MNPGTTSLGCVHIVYWCFCMFGTARAVNHVHHDETITGAIKLQDLQENRFIAYGLFGTSMLGLSVSSMFTFAFICLCCQSLIGIAAEPFRATCNMLSAGHLSNT